MGKKSKLKKKNKNKNKQPPTITHNTPFVSVCTPTYNRRLFIPQLIKCFKNQTYPKELMEWIVIDDGEDSVADLFEGVECVKYFRYEEKIKLGRKRNLMHEKSSGSILVYMDDDDYYPPNRVKHAVFRLNSRPEALCAGSSAVYIYFNDTDMMYQFGPYGPNHGTAGTFAFKRKLLETSKYDDEAELAEEKGFLQNYTVPFVQLDPEQTILVFAHQFNTFDKRKLLENPHPDYVKPLSMKPKALIKDKEMLKFYCEV